MALTLSSVSPRYSVRSQPDPGSNRGECVIDRAEVAARLDDGSLMVLDVRPELEFAAGHIAGARSVPISKLRRQLKNLPTILSRINGRHS